MAHSQKSSALVMLSKQLERPESDIIAVRNNQPLYVHDLKKQISLISNALKQNSCQYWALSMQDSFNFVAGLCALLYLGKHPILLNPFHQELEHHYEALLTDNSEITSIKFPQHQIVNIQQLKDLDDNTDLLPSHFKHNSLTLFTSGSTGIPKPIEKNITQLEHESMILMSYWKELTNDLFVSTVSHEHMYGLTFKIMLALATKTPFLCESILYQEQLLLFKNKKIFFITSPSILTRLDEKIISVKCNKVISAGGPLSYQEAQKCKQSLGVLPSEIYGSSETGIIAIRQQSEENTHWQLFSCMKIVFDEEQQQAILTSPLLEKQELLNDKIMLIDKQHFQLKGRIDKIIKISERRVSLTYIENQLNQLPDVEHSIVIPLELENRTILASAIQLSTSGKQKLQQLGHFKLSQYFRQTLKDKLSLVATPKKWRFIESFPFNQQGKCTYIELKSLFNNSDKIMKKLLPQEMDIVVIENKADLELKVTSDLFWFKGHFRSQPLLPGVTQLNWVNYYAQKLFNTEFNIASIDVVKFQIPVLPEDVLKLHLEWNKEIQKLTFTYSCVNKIVSSGKLKLC